MKALKKICTALMLLAFAFVFASCSNGTQMANHLLIAAQMVCYLL